MRSRSVFKLLGPAGLALWLSLGCGGNVSYMANTSNSKVSGDSTPPPSPTLLISGVLPLTSLGQTLQLHATETTGTATPVDVTATAVWGVTPAGALTVAPGGLVTCTAAGTVQISATKDGASASATLICSVPPPQPTTTLTLTGPTLLNGLGATGQLAAGLSSDGGKTFTDVSKSVTWNATPAGLLSFDTSGSITCVGIGNTVVTATKGNLSATLPVPCTLGASSLSLSRKHLSLRIGSSRVLTAFGNTPGNPQIDVTQSVTWMTASQIASVSSIGVVSCTADGTTSVTATMSSLTQSIPVVCSPSSWNTPSYFLEQSAEFVGPFASWVNVKTAFGAVGDGTTDDTAAIQAALNSLGTSSSNVLWFPAGTYAVNSLTITKKESFSLIGESPATTFLQYNGKPGGTVLSALGCRYFRISRLSIDGQQKANTGELLTQTPTGDGFYGTFIELSDQHIFGSTNGIDLDNTAETTVERVFFDNLPGFGVRTGNFNVLNIFINDSLFAHNGTGVTNSDNNGAGSFIVTNSFFDHSTTSDMEIGNTLYHTSRHNTSVGSKAFFISGAIGANPGVITIQNNTILDPVGIPFQLGCQGPLMLIDNVVRMRNTSMPAIMGFDDASVVKSVFSFGNTYTTDVAPVSGTDLAFQGVLDAFDDDVADPSSIPDVKIPTNVYVPPNLHRPIFDVAANSSSVEIQRQINLAAAGGQIGAVIHLPNGVYGINQSMLIPAGSNLQMIGDDPVLTTLYWNGTGTAPAIQANAANVTLSGFRIMLGSGSSVDAIRIPMADQPGNQFISDLAQLQYGNAYSVFFDGLEHASAELFSTYALGTTTGVNVVGGPFRKAKVGTLGVTNFYSGSAQATGTSTSFNVSQGGKLLVQDNWRDNGASGPSVFKLSGSGTLTEQSGAAYTTSNIPFTIGNFDGKVSLIGLMFVGGFSLHPGGATTNLLTLGMDGMDGSGTDYRPASSTNLVVANMLDEYYARGGHQLADSTVPDVKWLRGMFALTRAEYALPRVPLFGNSSRVRLSRTQIQSMASAVHLMPSVVSKSLFYTIAIGANTLTTGSKGTGACSSVPANTIPNSTSWTFVEAGDGDYVITDATGTNALGLVPADGSIALTPLDSRYDQRWIVQDVGDGRKIFQNRAAPGVLSWKSGNCPQLGTDATSDLARWTVLAN